jgi:hypothetical protein
MLPEESWLTFKGIRGCELDEYLWELSLSFIACLLKFLYGFLSDGALMTELDLIVIDPWFIVFSVSGLSEELMFLWNFFCEKLLII